MAKQTIALLQENDNEETTQKNDKIITMEDWEKKFTDPNGETYWSFNMKGALFWNYYMTWISLFMHVSIHALFLGMWCNYSKVVILYSVHIVLLHAYSWAIPDRRYAKWVQEKRNWFYGISGFNIFLYLMGVCGSIFVYNSSTNGMSKHTAFACLSYTLLSQTIMVIMFTVNYTTLQHRFDYEKNGYHGHVEYPAA